MPLDFSDRLRLAMQGPPKVSSVDLAKACRVRPPAVSAWLRGGVRAIKAPHLIAAAEFLGVRAKWLAMGVGPMKPAGADGHDAVAELALAMGDLTPEQRLIVLQILQLLLKLLREREREREIAMRRPKEGLQPSRCACRYLGARAVSGVGFLAHSTSLCATNPVPVAVGRWCSLAARVVCRVYTRFFVGAPSTI